MKCRQCGTDIADKALICFRCGTATTEAKFQAAPIKQRRRVPWAVIAAVLIALLVLLAFLLINSDALSARGVRQGSDPVEAVEVML